MRANKTLKTNVASISNASGSISYASNADLTNTVNGVSLRLGQITFNNLSVTGPLSSGQITLTVPITSLKDIQGGGALKPYETTIMVNVDGKEE